MTYLVFTRRYTSDAKKLERNTRKECLTQLAHRLYPLYRGSVRYSRNAFVEKIFSEEYALMRDGISLKRKPNKRLFKILQTLCSYITVSEMATRRGRRYVVKILLP